MSTTLHTVFIKTRSPILRPKINSTALYLRSIYLGSLCHNIDLKKKIVTMQKSNQIDNTPLRKEEKAELSLSQEESKLILDHAIRKIEEGRFDELDPTLGDNACHIRAICISQIASAFQSGQSLSSEELEYLIGVEFTTMASANLFSKNGILINDQSSVAFPNYLKRKYSCRQREIISYRYRERVAELGLNLLTTYLGSVPENPLQKTLLMSLTEDQRTLDRCSERIKCIPQFTAWSIINEIVQSNGLKFIVVFKTYGLVDNGNGVSLLNAKPVVFVKENGDSKNYIPAEVVDENDPTPCVCFEISSIVELNSAKPSVDLAELVLDLKSWNIIDILSACFALHCQYGKIKEENSRSSFMMTNETRNSLGDHYWRILKAAEVLTIIQDKPFFRIDSETLYVRMEPRLIAGGHAYCSTYKNVLGYCGKLCRQEILYKLVQFDKKTNSYYSSLDKFNELKVTKQGKY